MTNLETEKWINDVRRTLARKVSDKKNILLRDSIMVFKNIFHLAFKSDANKKDSTAISLRISLLEIIRDLLENPGPTFRNNSM